MKTQPTPMLPLFTAAAAAIANEAEFAGALPVERLPRLMEQLADSRGLLEVSLAIRREIARPPALRGRIQGRLQLICQRCLEPFEWPLDANVDLRLVTSETEEARWLQDYEPYLIEGDRLPLHAIAEDEVLLALPLAARCRVCVLPATPG